MGLFEDYYEILQVHHLAEPEIIEAAYKKLAQKYHPDVNKSATAMERMKKINIAHDILGDPEKRKRYDIEYIKWKGSTSKVDGTKSMQDINEKSQRAPEYDIVSRVTPPIFIHICANGATNVVYFNRHKHRYECSKCKRHWKNPQDIK